jgi:hypothetical protein
MMNSWNWAIVCWLRQSCVYIVLGFKTTIPNNNSHIVVLLPFQHKLNHYLFCQTFEKIFIICAKISIKSKFHVLGLNHRPSRIVI